MVEYEERFRVEVSAEMDLHKFPFDVQRQSGFYLWKVIVPFARIVMSTWSVFWMKGDVSGPRLNRAYFGLLIVATFHRTVAGYLPRSSDLSLMDYAVYIGYLFTVLTIIESLIVCHYVKSNRKEIGLKIDQWTQLLIPVSFVILTAVLFIVFLWQHQFR